MLLTTHALHKKIKAEYLHQVVHSCLGYMKEFSILRDTQKLIWFDADMNSYRKNIFTA